MLEVASSQCGEFSSRAMAEFLLDKGSKSCYLNQTLLSTEVWKTADFSDYTVIHHCQKIKKVLDITGGLAII